MKDKPHQQMKQHRTTHENNKKTGINKNIKKKKIADKMRIKQHITKHKDLKTHYKIKWKKHQNDM